MNYLYLFHLTIKHAHTNKCSLSLILAPLAPSQCHRYKGPTLPISLRMQRSVHELVFFLSVLSLLLVCILNSMGHSPTFYLAFLASLG